MDISGSLNAAGATSSPSMPREKIPAPLRPVRAGVPSRRKACTQCTKAKTRCDLRRPSCGRCTTRELQCHFTGAAELEYVTPSTVITNDNTHLCCFPAPATALDVLYGPINAEQHAEVPYIPKSLSQGPTLGENRSATQGIDPQKVSLVSSVDFLRIRDRWLEVFISSPMLQTPKHYLPQTISLISRVLKSYPRMMSRGDGSPPPFIHSLQLAGKTPVPLANCVSLTRMWYDRAAGSESLVRETVAREMARIVEEFSSFNHTDALAALQAYLLYSVMSFFAPSSDSEVHDLTTVFTGPTLVSLQSLAAQLSETGVICAEELSSTRPQWESWVVAEAKRRTLYTMYLLENVYNWRNENVSYRADELAMLPAPCGKRVWEARTREGWERRYDGLLREWDEKGLRMHELWPQPGESEERARRVDRWAEDLDEFGMLLLGVCTVTHGS